MPLNVQRVLRRAIDARKRCAAWFEKRGMNDIPALDGHAFFIDVLQKAFDTLKRPNEDIKRPHAASADPPPSTKPSAGVDFDSAGSDTTSGAPSDAHGPASENKPRDKSKSPIYEPEESTWDVRFSIFCLFEDLHKIREQVIKVWTEYNKGELDLVSASIITQAAIELVRRAEKEIYQTYADFFPTQSYEKLVYCLWCGSPFSDKLADGKLDPIKIGPFDEFIFLPTAQILFRFAIFRNLFTMGSWPPPVFPLSLHFISSPEALTESPRMREAEEEDRILSQLFLDMILQDKVDCSKQWEAVQLQQLATFPLDEVFKESLNETTYASARVIWKKGIVSLQNVFTWRLFLDVWRICGKTFEGANMLTSVGNQITKLLFIQHDSSNRNEIRWPRTADSLLRHISHLIEFRCHRVINSFIKMSVLEQHASYKPPDKDTQMRIASNFKIRSEPERKQLQENMEKLDLNFIMPPDEYEFMINRNPLYVGDSLMNLYVQTGYVGIELANHSVSIFSFAHLYNAWRQMGLVESLGLEWNIIEMMMDSQIVPLFAGEFPTTPGAIASRYRYRMGRTSAGNSAFLKRRPWLFRLPAADAIRQFFGDVEQKERGLHSLQELFQKRNQQASGSRTGSSKRANTSHRQLTPVQFMKQLLEHIPGMVVEMTIDYITLTQNCSEIIEGVYKELESSNDFEFVSREKTSEDNLCVTVTEFILDSNAEQYESFTRVGRPSEPFTGGPALKLAAKAFGEFLTKERERQKQNGTGKMHGRFVV
ncbi:predicted protein [Uncinocarpus reesii 1704]|uniref:DUF6604 domain-containing protein n=1 Tax=Uncinocarpus reesii (strain UAMH 1704) TaxID=336963 RepID=C4JUN5_UNCRE|nr:uncharacterized protein UREG_04838 [Uncinocarpus reesii 1704]EEP79996.1 predicted protein [Uncinocarpus reesii 1704]